MLEYMISAPSRAYHKSWTAVVSRKAIPELNFEYLVVAESGWSGCKQYPFSSKQPGDNGMGGGGGESGGGDGGGEGGGGDGEGRGVQ